MTIRACIVGLAWALCLAAEEPSAWDLYQQGRAAEKAGHMAQAYLFYSEAAALKPADTEYWMRSQAVRSRALMEAKPAAAVTAAVDAAAGDTAAQPDTPRIEPATARDLADARQPLPPTTLGADAAVQSFDIHKDPKQTYLDVAHAFGLECVFDADYEPGPPFHFAMEQASYREALHGLELATGTFVVVLGPKRFLVSKDTQQKRNQNEPYVAVSIHLPESTTPQDLTTLVTSVQQAMTIEKVSFDTASQTVVLRDRLSKVLPARALFEELIRPRAQVMVDMELLEVSRNDMLTYGVNFPTEYSLTPLTPWLGNLASVTLAPWVVGLLGFGGGKTHMGIGIMNASLVAQMSMGSGRQLLDAQVRSGDGQAASFHVGDRYPVLTSGYTGDLTGINPLTLAPAFDYVDLGLTFKVTPYVHGDDEVTLDLDAEFKLLTGSSINGIPVISNREIKTTSRMAFGDWAVVSGLIDTNEALTISGLAGVSRIPYLGALTSTREHDTSRDEVLVLIRPRLLLSPSMTSVPKTYLVGTETKPITPL